MRYVLPWAPFAVTVRCCCCCSLFLLFHPDWFQWVGFVSS
jgi:hypothetical protein